MTGEVFLDSGAHSLYTKHYLTPGGNRSFYDGDEFYIYADSYADYLKHTKIKYTHYANVDAIFNPERSWEMLTYLEDVHGLSPVPVVHHGTELDPWLRRHIDAGYKVIGLGGLGQKVSKESYFEWADRAFEMLAKHAPKTHVHGFAMTAVELLNNNAWDSVDSKSWIDQAARGRIFVPRKKDGEYDFGLTPRRLHISLQNTATSRYQLESDTKARPESKIAREWLESIGINYEEARCHHGPRMKANVIYFDTLARQEAVQLFYSGQMEEDYRPQNILPIAHIMPTYYEIHTKGSKEPVSA